MPTASRQIDELPIPQRMTSTTPLAGCAGLYERHYETVFRTDIDLKRTAGDPRVLLERLVVELCERQRRT